MRLHVPHLQVHFRCFAYFSHGVIGFWYSKGVSIVTAPFEPIMFHYVAIKPPVVRVYVDCKLLGGKEYIDPYLNSLACS
jgi:hypothetical protein